MADRERVIKGLECCLKESDHLYSNPCNGCPYEGQECIDRMNTDALALLKEQDEETQNLRRENHNILTQFHEWAKEQEKQKFFVDENGKITPLPVVVRCKDCIHWDDHIEECSNSDSVCFRNGWTKPDWFCADGIAKEGNDEPGQNAGDRDAEIRG